MREASLYKPLADSRVRCTACSRYCNIPAGKIGLCGVRQNVGGKLQLLVYGKVIAGQIDPIEKKPVTHFMPGSRVFSIATTGCNWLCRYCQNFDISQRRMVDGTDMNPVQVANMARDYGCEGLAYTYNQPTIFMEFAHDVGVEARRKGLINIFVSNGYDTPDTVAMMNDFLDCITIDFKGNAETGFVRKYIGIADAEPIFQTILEIKNKTKVHMEFTDLVIPGVGDRLEDARKLSRWLYDNLGPEYPIHFLRFHPDYKMMEFPHTPVKTLEEHCRVAREEGLQYVYVGNVPGHPWEHTYCPGCKNVAVGRNGFDITAWNLDENNKCKNCGHHIPITGTLSLAPREKILPIIH
jgi:pyruvate formate lyase activating enzyme